MDTVYYKIIKNYKKERKSLSKCRYISYPQLDRHNKDGNSSTYKFESKS